MVKPLLELLQNRFRRLRRCLMSFHRRRRHHQSWLFPLFRLPRLRHRCRHWFRLCHLCCHRHRRLNRKQRYCL
jgi:hypothetical protein